MNTTRRGRKVLALAAASAIVFAACGSDDDSGSSDSTPAATEAPTDGTEAPSDTTATTEEPAGEPVFRITYELSDTAVWNDGTPITAADFDCTVKAHLGTPEAVITKGFDSIVSVSEGDSPSQVVVEMSKVYAPYKTLFGNGLLKADEIADCNDVTDDFEGGIKFSAREWILDSWTPEQITWIPNPGYTGKFVPTVDKLIVVPAEDGTTLLKSGAVDFIFPQAYTGIDEELNDPSVEFDAALGGSYEALYFQQDPALAGPFSDADYRKAFAKSIDMDAFYEQIYAPFAQGTPLLTCGPVTPGIYCDPEVFAGTYDPEGATQILTDAGWTQNGEGFWQNPDGEVPEVRWMVNTGNTRRESAQAYLIPLLAEAGFKVVADNCEGVPCVFQTRLPALDYDLAMYISTVAPDPDYLSDNFLCSAIPTEENGFAGQNNTGWCNEEADALLQAADGELDETARAEDIKGAIALMREDLVLLPTLQFPNIGAYRTDKLANTQAELANYRATWDWYQWEDVDGDGQIVYGAEQYPAADCPNPINGCSNSSWYFWVGSNPALPAPFDTTADQTFVIGEMLASEPVVEEL